MTNRTLACADKIIEICNELKVLFAKDSTFDLYEQKLIGKLQKLSLGLDEYHSDADDEDNNGGSHGNTKIPFGLCQREGIAIDPKWAPKDAWNALEGKGYSAGEVYKELKETGKVEKRVEKTNQKTGEVYYERYKPMAAEEAEKAIAEYDAALEAKKRERAQIEEELTSTVSQRGKISSEILELNRQVRKLAETRSYPMTYEERKQSQELERKIIDARASYDELNAKVKELTDKLNATKVEVTDPQLKKRYVEAMTAKYPTWDDCKTGKQLQERVSALASADSKYWPMSAVVKGMESHRVTYSPPKKVKKPAKEGDLISGIGGGDETKGSCASVAFAYLAGKAGYEIKDFRGGASQSIMASQCCSLVRSFGGSVEYHTSDLTASKALFSKMEEGKEYWFASGKHSAAIRKNNGVVEYLELQSRTGNGWKELTEDRLRKRFGCQKSHTSYGRRVDAGSYLIDAKTLTKSPEFIATLGYINTEADMQKKGIHGGIK